MSTEVKRLPVDDVPDEVYDILRELGAPQYIKGYHQLAYAIHLYEKDLINNPMIHRAIYYDAARAFDVPLNRIERNIRFCIEAIFSNPNCYDAIQKYFGNSISPKRGKATNGQFISVVANEVHRRLVHNNS